MNFEDMPYDVQHCGVKFLSQDDDTRVQLDPEVPADSTATTTTVIYARESTLDSMSNTEWQCTGISSSTGYGSRDLDSRNQYVNIRFAMKREVQYYIVVSSRLGSPY